MTLDINNSITSSEKELSGRAQRDVADNSNNNKSERIERSFFQQLSRGPAKAPPKLDESYSLDESLKAAYERAVNFANKVLLDDDLSMTINHHEDEKSFAVVKNIQNEQVVQEYDAIQVLQMYSSNYNLQGIVIDALI
jgi:hypothetical protein|tara:strand:+ start:198 stop:611 length:414 start_codon:yes stop_codon:yes gene_type:complete